MKKKVLESGDGDAEPRGALVAARDARMCQLLPWHWGVQDCGSPWPHMSGTGPHIERSAGREVARLQA